MTEPFDDFDEDTPTTDAEDDGDPIDDPDPPDPPDDPDTGLVVEIASNAAASAWTDLTSRVDLYGAHGVHESLHAGGVAHRAEVGTGSGFDFEDEAAAYAMPVKRVVRIRDTASSPNVILLRGRVAEYNTGRGFVPVADERSFGVSLVDANAELRGIPIRKWTRPAETDIARMTALWTTFLKGSPRASTRLKPTYLRNANAVTMPAKVYENTDPAGVAADCAEAAKKEVFVTEDHEIFYDLPISTAYAADLAITDVAPDGIDTFAPQWTDGDPALAGGDEFLSGVVATWSGGRVARVRSSVESAHDYWREAVGVDAKSTADATKRATAILDEHAREEMVYRCSIDLRSADVGRVKKGQLISFRAAAAAVLTPTTLRIGRLVWEPLAPQLYRAHLELSVPLKLGSRLPGGPSAPDEAITTDGAAVALTRYQLFKEDGAGPFGPAAGVWNTVAPDFDFGALGSGDESEIDRGVYANLSWPYTDCGVSSGADVGRATSEAWYRFTVDLSSGVVIGVQVDVDAMLVATGKAIGADTIVVGIHTGASSSGAELTDKGQFTEVGRIGSDGGSMFIPRSLLIDVADGCCWLVLAPGWEVPPDAMICVADDNFLGGHAEAGTNSTTVVSMTTVEIGGAGLSPWVPGVGDVDGTNATFELTGWDGTGVPEARVGVVILGAGEYSYDAGALTVTLNTPPPAAMAGQVAFRYRL